MRIRATRSIGWRRSGDEFDSPVSTARLLIKAGAAVPIAAPVGASVLAPVADVLAALDELQDANAAERVEPVTAREMTARPTPKRRRRKRKYEDREMRPEE